MKILIYIVYAVVFTGCYYFLNKKLSNKWILIGYPLFFCVSLFPIKLIYDAIVPNTGKIIAKEYLLLMLFAVAMITLFNFFYGIVNLMLNKQVSFQQSYGMPDKAHVKWFMNNVGNINGLYHLFFYAGGIILYGVVVSQAKI
jgi:hypothetical protein